MNFTFELEVAQNNIQMCKTYNMCYIGKKFIRIMGLMGIRKTLYRVIMEVLTDNTFVDKVHEK